MQTYTQVYKLIVMSSKLKTKILSLSILFSLTGCNDASPPPASPAPEQKQIEQVQAPVAAATATAPAGIETSEAEKQELKEFLEEAKKRDPNIVDAYYSVDENGNKIINLVRNASPAPTTAEGEKAAEASKDEGLGMLETVGLAMAGGMVGSMLANALVPNNPAPDHYQQNSAYYQRQTPEEAERYRNNAVSNYNNYSANNGFSRPIGKSSTPPATPIRPSSTITTTTTTTTSSTTNNKPVFREVTPSRGFKKSSRRR